MFKGAQPGGQPPSLRKIAESNGSGNFRTDERADRQPEPKDVVAPLPTPRRETAAGKNPFKGIRNG